MADISLRAHHLENAIYFRFTDFLHFDELHRDYEPGFRAFVKSTYEHLLNNPSLIVRIKNGLDDIYNHASPQCSKDPTKCLGGSRDELVERCYGLSVGKEYSVQELLGIAVRFKEEYGFLTPLNWLWMTNDLNAY